MHVWSQHIQQVTQRLALGDREHAEDFICRYEHNPETFRLYRREMERLILWVNCVAHKHLQQLTRRDMREYRRYFLTQEDKPDDSPRLLRSKLSENSVNLSLRVLNSFFSYLIENHYITENPLYGLSMRTCRGNDDRDQGVQQIDDLQLAFILREVECLPYHTEKQQAEAERMRFLLALFQFIGADIASLEMATHHAFAQVNNLWWFRYSVRRGADFCIQVNEPMLNALRRFREFHGLRPYPADDEAQIPLLPNLYIGENARSARKTGITARRVRQLIKRLFLRAMVSMQRDGFEDQADALQHASLHALQELGRQKLIE